MTIEEATDDYFSARPQLDSGVNRRIFCAGYNEGIKSDEVLSLRTRIAALEAKLDICKRYAEGEIHDPVWLAVDYGGTDYEKDPAVQAVAQTLTVAQTHMTDNIKLPPMPKPHTPPVFATAANTPSVKAGYELGGYEKTPPLFDEHQLEAYACEAVRLNAQAVPDEWGREVWRTKLENLISEYGGERATEAYHGGHFCKRNPTAIRKEIAAMLSAAPQPAQPLTDEQIKRIMLDNGFTIKEGLADLKPYVYAAARALIAATTGVKND